MHVVIMGCGRVGSAMALALDAGGHSVSVIDRSRESFRRLGPEFGGRTVQGVGFDRDVLVAAGIERAGAFAAVSSGDNSNIISTRVARETYGVPRVVARIYDARRAEVFERLGIPTVASVPWASERLLRMLLGGTSTSCWRDPTGNVSMVPLRPHAGWTGFEIAALERATRGRAAVVLRFGSALVPTSGLLIHADDEIFTAVPDELVEDAVEVAEAPPTDDD